MRRALATLALLQSLHAFGDVTTPNNERGFDPQKAYAQEEVGIINLFNGNLNVSIPIGIRYTVSSTLSYQLTLQYGGNNWEHEVIEDLVLKSDGDCETQIDGEEMRCNTAMYGWAYPSRRDNAGFGWRLHMGQLVWVTGPVGTRSYESPDGAVHAFYPTLHLGKAEESPNTEYSRDGSYLRKTTEGNNVTIESPDGLIRTFDDSPGSTGGVTEIRDRFGNRITIDYDATQSAPLPSFAGPYSAWSIEDSTSRKHYVYFRPSPSYHEERQHEPAVSHSEVAEVRLDMPDGPATWKFQYFGGEALGADPAPWTVLARPCPGGESPILSYDHIGGTVQTAVLEKLIPPVGNPYTFTYDLMGSDTGQCAESSGALRSLTLPTLGKTVWTYGLNHYPANVAHPVTYKNPASMTKSVAVRSRTVTDRDGTVLAKRTYDEYADPVFLNQPTLEKHVTVTDRDGENRILQKSRSFFSLCSYDCPAPVARGDYALPFTRKAQTEVTNPVVADDGTSRWLSTIAYGPDGNGVWDVPLQLSYVDYEADVPLTETIQGWTDFNRRVKAQRTVHRTNGTEHWTDIASSEFDGLGHYRVQDERASFGGVQRTTTRFFNPASGRFSPTGTSYFVMPSDWLLELQSFTKVTEATPRGTSTQLTEFCYDPAIDQNGRGTGFLVRQRVRKDAALPGRQDLLTVFHDEAIGSGERDGNVSREEFYGGDTTLLPEEHASTCTFDLVDTAAYALTHTYSYGKRNSTQYVGASFKSLDLDIDESGLPVTSRDTTGLATTYHYDLLGRLRQIDTAGPSMIYDYVAATASSPASVEATQWPTATPAGNALTESRYYYDGLGRLMQQRTRMGGTSPGAAWWSATAYRYDALGRLGATSVAVRTNSGDYAGITAVETVTAYDALGRPERIVQPDGSVRRQTYEGARRTERWAMAPSPSTKELEKATEDYDGLGRIAKVTQEPSPGKSVVTEYDYNAGGHLTHVTMSGDGKQQERVFAYDGRGLLRSEMHPEAAEVTYQYDARGHAVSRAVQGGPTVTFVFDAAERLERVDDGATAIKGFTFGPATERPGRREHGKLTSATRRNRLTTGEVIEVTERYEYDTLDGRNPLAAVSKHTTTIADVTGGQHTTIQEFAREITEFDPLGLASKMKMPACITIACNTAGGFGDITLSRENGSVATVAADGAQLVRLERHPAGMVARVIHPPTPTSIVADVYETVSDIPRPSTIRFEGETSCIPPAPVINAPTAICAGSTAAATVPLIPGTAYSWSITGGSITSGADTNQITFSASGAPVTLTLRAYNACGDQTVTKNVAINAPVAPSVTISAPAAVCPNTMDHTASVPAIPGYTYKWEVTGSGRASSGVHSNVLSFSAGDSSVELTLTMTDACGIGTTFSKEIAMRKDGTCEWPCIAEWSRPLATGYVAVNDTSQIPLDVAVRLKGATADSPGPYEALSAKFTWFQEDVKQQSTGSQHLLSFDRQTYFRVEATLSCKAAGSPAEDSPTITSKSSAWRNGHCVVPVVAVQSTAVRLSGAEVTLLAESPYGAAALQWYAGESGNTVWPIQGANAPELTVNAPGTFWLRASMDCGTTSDSPTIVVSTSACAPVRIESDPSDVSIEAGSNVVLSVAAIGSPLPESFQWNSRPTAVVREGNGERTITIRNVQSTGEYFVQVGNGCSWAPSRPARVRVVSCDGITITAQPADVTIDDQATLSIAASGAGLTYQWYIGSSGDTSHEILHATSPTLRLSRSMGVADRYWVRVTGAVCAVDSRTAEVCRTPHLTIPMLTDYANALPRVERILQIGADGTALSYAWYEGTPEGSSRPYPSHSNAATVWPDVTTRYFVEIKGPCASQAPLRIATRVSVPPTITSVTSGGWVTRNATRTLTVAASGTELTYQWYDADTGEAISGADRAEYVTPELSTNRRFFCRVKSGIASRDTEVIPFLVLQPRAIRIANYPDSASGSLAVLEILDPAPEETYEWYQGPSGVTAMPLGGGTQVSVHPLATTTYWARTRRDSAIADAPALTVNVCVPAITAQPSGGWVNKGAQTTLNVTATGTAPLTYSWYQGNSGDTTLLVAQGTANTYTTPTSLATTTSYWVRVSGPTQNCTSNSRDSAAATVNVCIAPEITGQPVDVTASAAGTTLQVQATGTELTYQWYAGTTGVVTTPIGSPSATPSVAVAPTVTTSYWVRVSGRCGSADSNAAIVSRAPTIVTQPASSLITKNTSVTLSVAANGTQLGYEWYQRVASGAIRIDGATLPTFTTPLIASDARFFCRIRSGAATTDSADAVLTVLQPRSIRFANSPDMVSGSLVILQVDGAVAEEAYEWYQGGSGTTNIPLGGGTQLSVRPVATTDYWLRTRRSGAFADGPALTVRICYPKVVEQPVSKSILRGQQATLTVTATGTPTITYQWYEGSRGDTSKPVAGATGSSFSTPTTLASTTTYWVRVTSPSTGCAASHADSDAATVTVCQPPEITQQPVSDNYPKNTLLTLTVTATGDNLQYQWYRGARGDTSQPLGDNTCQLTLYAASTQSYWVRVTGSCGSVDSQAAMVSVFPVITQHPANATVCGTGSSATFTAAATGAEGYRWYRTAGGVTEEVGATQTLTIPVNVTPVSFRAYAWSGNAATPTNPASASILPKPTLNGFTATPYGATQYTLTADVAAAERPNVSYRFYRGALGDTSTLLRDSTASYLTVTPPYKPITYWVRVYNRTSPTQCFSDGALTLQ